MKTNHLSPWDQEEYVLGQRTPQMLRHLSECAACEAEVERLEQGVAAFRTAAVSWSAECLSTRPQQPQFAASRRFSPATLRWAFAAVIPIVLLILVLLPIHDTSAPHPVAQANPVSQTSDDALLEQVDEQVSEAVPSSMESLTHLVSTDSGTTASAQRSKHIVQTN
jgi:anti-sigma factor RsiW